MKSISKILKDNLNLNNINNSTTGNSADLQCKTLADCAVLLKRYGAAVAVLQVEDLQAYWLGIMSDAKASNKDKLAASKLYAQSIGAFDRIQTGQAAGSGAVYKWANHVDKPIDVKPVTEPENGNLT